MLCLLGEAICLETVSFLAVQLRQRTQPQSLQQVGLDNVPKAMITGARLRLKSRRGFGEGLTTRDLDFWMRSRWSLAVFRVAAAVQRMTNDTCDTLFMYIVRTIQ
jgi:hypothetical protein